MKKLCALLSCLVLIFSMTACSNSTQEPVTAEVDEMIDMKIGIDYHLGCALFFIAEEAGYYEDYGLNVELVPFDSSANKTIKFSKSPIVPLFSSSFFFSGTFSYNIVS